MSDFGHFSSPVARKVHKCEHCLCEIPVGDKHTYWAGRYDGSFYAYRVHSECAEAAIAYSLIAGLYHDDDHPWLHEIGEDEPEDREWLKTEYPEIHARMEARREARRQARVPA